MSDLSLMLDESVEGTPSYRDLVIQDGDLVLTSDVSTNAASTDPTMQQIAQNLLWCLGEWFLDTSGGTGWLQTVVRKGAQQQDIDALIQDRILATPGVAILTAYKTQAFRAQRVYRISFSVITVAGARLSSTLPVNLGLGA